jgi:hypothetical protein
MQESFMRQRHSAPWLLLGLSLLLSPQVILAAEPANSTDDIRAKIKAAGDAEKWNADLVYVFDHTDVTVQPDGLGLAKNHQVFKILRDGGARSQAVQRFKFDPYTNRLDLIAVRIYRADGTLEEIPIDHPLEQPQPASGIFWPTAQYLIPLPHLEVGDAVETQTEMTGFNVAYLEHDAPAAREATSASAATGSTRVRAYGTSAAKLSAVIRQWATAQESTDASCVPLLEAAASSSAGPKPEPPAKAKTAAKSEPEAPTRNSGKPAAEEAEHPFNNLNALGHPLQPPVPGHWHDEVHFWSGYPIIEKRYTVRLPKDKPLQTEVYSGELRSSVLFDGDEIVYTFEKDNIEPFKGEPSMESVPNVGTKLLCATLPTWVDKARWLNKVSEPQFAWDDAIAAKVKEVTKGCKTDEEKYTALNHWVAENIRYAGTSRGMCEGYTIHRSIETFHDRCGVCKDKAGMLVTMLRAAGFDSYLVMTMARQRVDRVPADQFNHAVTCFRDKTGKLTLLDPTWMVKNRDNWSTLEPLQHVVYGIPEGKELSQSPYFPPEDCTASWKGQTAISEDNELTGGLEFHATGGPEGRVRRTLAAYPADERGRVFDASFARISPLTKIGNLTCMDPVDFSGPIKLSATFGAEDFAVGSGNLRYFKLPLMQTPLGDRALLDLPHTYSLEKRKYAVKLLSTRLAKIDETVKLPPGWKVVDAPKPVKIDGPSAGLQFDIESTPGQVHYTCELTIKKWQIPPEEYANYKEVMEKFDELAGPVMVCELEGAHVER